MKKIICVTPKISFTEYKNERIELEYNWINYLKKMNYQVMTLNETNISYFKKFKPSCIIISGGGDIFDISKKKINLKRDTFEINLFKLFYKKIPIICVCRGAQLIGSKIYKSKLYKVNNHIRTNHDIFNKKIKLNVNSYHKYSFKILDKSFNEVFYHKDKSIELAISSKNKVMLSMFHPERPNEDQNKINKIIKLFLN